MNRYAQNSSGLSSSNLTRVHNSTEAICDDFMHEQEILDIAKHDISTPLVKKEELLKSADFSVRTWNCLKRLGITTQTQINEVTCQQVMSCKNAGSKTWSEIRVYQEQNINEVQQMLAQQNSLDYSTFKNLSRSYLHEVLHNERNEEIVWARWKANVTGDTPTLDALGQDFGITRERVRQILKRGEKKLKENFMLISRFWQTVSDFTGPKQVISSLTDLVDYLCTHFNWTDRPNMQNVRSLVEINSEFKVADPDNIHTIQTKNKKKIISSIAKVISQIVLFNETQENANDLWCIKYETFRKLVGQHCHTILEEIGLPSFPEYLVDLAISQTSLLVQKKDSFVYSSNLWALRFGSLLEVVETILLRNTGVMHFEEVYKEALIWRPYKRLSKHNIHACLDRSSKAILWERGSFIHRDHISIPYTVIRQVESWLLDHLAEDVPVYCAHGLYKSFSKALLLSRIPSETALYSCLRISSHPKLCYPRYPYILRNGKTRLPITLLLEEYLQQAGSTVPLKELRSYACDTLGIDEVQFNLKLSDIQNTIRVDHDSYLHTDWLSIDTNLFDNLKKYVQDLLHRHQHVSVLRIFEDKQITCLRMGIVSPEMLYSLLELYSSNEFNLGHFPQLSFSTINDDSKSIASVKQSVLVFLKEKARPCNIAELEDHFVTQRRYGHQNICAIAQNHNVLSYAHGCVVHREVLNISQQTQQHIEDLAYSAFTAKESQGELFILAEDILEFCELPLLPNGISWTPTLLTDILSKNNSFKVLGSAKKAIIPVLNKHNIISFEDFIRVIVQEQYSGTVQVQILEEYLRVRKIINRCLTEKMLKDESKVRIIDGEVFAVENDRC